MRALFWFVPLMWLVACPGALAAESVSVNGRTVGVMQYPATNTICLRFEATEGRHFLICDDVTAKNVIEQLFALGKKDVSCHIEGTVAKKSGEAAYLRVSRVSQETK